MKPIPLIFDGVLALMSAAIGFFIGLALLLMAQLIVTGAWASVIILIGYSILMYIIVVATNWAMDFPNAAGTKKTSAYERRRKRNGRIGFGFGAAAAFVASMFISPEQIVGLF